MEVLLAHGDLEVRRSAGATLARIGCRVVEAATAAEAVKACRALRPSVAIIDVEMCRHEGAGLLRAIKGDPELFPTSVVLAHRGMDPGEAMAALDDGAHDLLAVPFAPAELLARVRSASRARALRGELLTRAGELEDLAYTDPLTGLVNRRYLERRMGALVAGGRRHHRAFSVVIADIDGFKAINDEHGHPAGDDALRTVARCLRDRVRREDEVGRWAGDEFLCLLPDTRASGAEHAAEGLRAAVASTPADLDGRPWRLKLSAGFATWSGESAEELVERADAALYAAKRAGRDRVAGDAR